MREARSMPTMIMVTISTIIIALTLGSIFGIGTADATEFTEGNVEDNLISFRGEIEPSCAVGGEHGTDVRRFRFDKNIDRVYMDGDEYKADIEGGSTVSLSIRDCTSVNFCEAGSSTDPVTDSCTTGGEFLGGVSQYKARYYGDTAYIMPVRDDT